MTEECQKRVIRYRGPDTDHVETAIRTSSGTATDHAERRGGAAEPPWRRGGRATLRPNAQVRAARTDRADNEMDNLLLKLFEFLSTVLREVRRFARSRHATEQASSSAGQDDNVNMVCGEDCICHISKKNLDEMNNIVWRKIGEWTEDPARHQFYSEELLLLHKKMFDILLRTKAGTRREDWSFGDWCKRVAMHSQTSSTATGQYIDSIDRSKLAETVSYRALAEDIFRNELTREQAQDPKQKLRQGKSVPTKLRSTMNSILRKQLGDPHAVFFIFTNGVPTLLDPEKALYDIERSRKVKALLQNMLEDLMVWHASMLQSILERQQHPNTAIARRLSDPEQKQWQNERRENKAGAKQYMDHGERLVNQIDSGKRKAEHMSATEQQIIQDFQSRKSIKQHEQACVRRPPPLSNKMLRTQASW